MKQAIQKAIEALEAAKARLIKLDEISGSRSYGTVTDISKAIDGLELHLAEGWQPNISMAARDVVAERLRQIAKEGWSPKHDDEHDRGELGLAAACYAAPVKIRARMEVPCCNARGLADCPHIFPKLKWMWAWPWDKKWWKPKDRRRDLIRAGALILAEIERLDRATPQPPAGRSHE